MPCTCITVSSGPNKIWKGWWIQKALQVSRTFFYVQLSCLFYYFTPLNLKCTYHGQRFCNNGLPFSLFIPPSYVLIICTECSQKVTLNTIIIQSLSLLHLLQLHVLYSLKISCFTPDVKQTSISYAFIMLPVPCILTNQLFFKTDLLNVLFWNLNAFCTRTGTSDRA